MSNMMKAVRDYAQSDLNQMIHAAKRNGFKNVNVDNLTVKIINQSKNQTDIKASASIHYVVNGKFKRSVYSWTYSVEGDDIWMEKSVKDHCRIFASQLSKASGRYIKGSAILAADEDDEFEDPGFDEFEDPGFDEFEDDESMQDTLDDMQDNIEDMQDDLDEIQEDDTDIEIDNNIDGHYIAECEKCHGIFISAMIESDQDVEKISGVCPLCEKESDQYLKWVVKSIE